MALRNITRRDLRLFVSDRISQVIDEQRGANPAASAEQIEQEVTEQLEEEFGATDWWAIIKMLIELLLPLLLAMKTRRNKTSEPASQLTWLGIPEDSAPSIPEGT